MRFRDGQGSKPGSAEGHVLVERQTVTPWYLPWEGGSCQGTCKPFSVKREGWQHLGGAAAVQGEETLQHELSSGKSSGGIGDTLLAHGIGTQDAYRAQDLKVGWKVLLGVYGSRRKMSVGQQMPSVALRSRLQLWSTRLGAGRL